MGIREYELRIMSEGGEDGVIEHLLKAIGMWGKPGVFCEFGIGSPAASNTSRLVRDFRWKGALADIDEHCCHAANEFLNYAGRGGGDWVDVRHMDVTPENINELVPEGCNFLSVDIDCNDYWVWEAVKAEPELVVVEFNSTFGDRSITIPYTPGFNRDEAHPTARYFGASLEAFVKLGVRKGYRFVGVTSNGVNAFFVREDKAEEAGLDVPSIDGELRSFGWTPDAVDEVWEQIKEMPYVEIK